MKIRPYRPADQRAVKELILQGLAEHFGTVNPQLNPDLNDIYASYVAPGHLFVVIEDHGQIIGTGALIKEEAKTGRIVRVSVAHSHRRQGIGRQITDHLITQAPRFGYEQILVETNDDWISAIRLYQDCGFQEYDRRGGEIHFKLKLES